MAIHTDLPIYHTGVQLLDLAVRVQEQMPRGLKRIMGEKITQHCVDILELMALANAAQRAQRVAWIEGGAIAAMALRGTPVDSAEEYRP